MNPPSEIGTEDRGQGAERPASERGLAVRSGWDRLRIEKMLRLLDERNRCGLQVRAPVALVAASTSEFGMNTPLLPLAGHAGKS